MRNNVLTERPTTTGIHGFDAIEMGRLSAKAQEREQSNCEDLPRLDAHAPSLSPQKKTQQGVCMSSIMDHIQDSTFGSLNRDHLITHADLHNIKHQ